MTQLGTAIAINLASDCLFVLVQVLYLQIWSHKSASTTWRVGAWVLGALAATGALYAIYTTAAAGQAQVTLALAALTSASLAAIPLTLVLRLRSMGIFSARKTQESRGWTAAELLSQANGSFRLLGTGASKFTDSDKFEENLRRLVRTQGSVQFLVCSPKSETLRSAASLAKEPIGDYERRVKNSLEEILRLQDQLGSSIEVRCYAESPRYLRLVFVDESLFLSYNVYGEPGRGGRSPALRISKSGHGTTSFYWAFERYFQEEWDNATTLTRDMLENSMDSS